jgi:hypothetical protein
MNAIIVGATTAIVAVTSLAVPVGATVGGGYIAGNSGFSTSSSGRIGMKDGKFYVEGETTVCTKMNAAMGGNWQFGSNGPTATVPNANLPSADTTNCNATDVVNNPPANSTVTINGLCDADAAQVKAHVSGDNVTVIVNSTGACATGNNGGTTVPTTPITVVVTPTAPQPNGGSVQTASVTTPAASNGSNSKTVAELPHTGIDGVMASVITTGLAVVSYAGTMAVRAFRARA